jgi:uncharacterized protein with FMN-binding domain
MWLVLTATALVLLFSYRTSTGGSGGTDTTAAVAPAGVVAQSSTASSSIPSPSSSTATATPTTRVVNGVAVSTRYGPVQVQIRVSGTRIVAADAIVYLARGRRDQEINSYAIPVLDDEAVQAQSAGIDTVSGATYTSDGYRASLQSAIDAAHLS